MYAVKGKKMLHRMNISLRLFRFKFFMVFFSLVEGGVFFKCD